MKRIIVYSEAELELWKAVEYYETKYVGLGMDFEREVSRSFIDIQEAPKKWALRRYGTRCRLLHRLPYAIYNLEIQDVIWVVTVAHTGRRPYYWCKRLKNSI